MPWPLAVSYYSAQVEGGFADGCTPPVNFMNDTIAERAYSRKLEYEADKLGVQVG